MHLALALSVGGRIAPLKKVVVEFVDPAGAGLARRGADQDSAVSGKTAETSLMITCPPVNR